MAERKQKVSIPLTVLSVLIAVIVVFPIVWMVLSSFKPSGELFSYPLHLFSQDPTVEHYASVLAGGFMGYVKNSLFLAVVGTLITLVISSMCGYALAIYRFEIDLSQQSYAESQICAMIRVQVWLSFLLKERFQ